LAVMPRSWKRAAATAAMRSDSGSTRSWYRSVSDSCIVAPSFETDRFSGAHMPQVMVRYRVRPERVAENEALVEAVYAELAAAQPAGLRYATFRLPDGVTFVHVAEHDADNPLPKVAAFRRF